MNAGSMSVPKNQLLAFLLLTFTSLMITACKFPKVLRGEGHYIIASKDPDLSKEHYFRKVKVTNSMITVSAMLFTDVVISDIATYKCLSKKGGNKYVVDVLKHGQDKQYACMAFIERTPYVVQWKIGKLTASRDTVSCDNQQMKLQDAPMVNAEKAENVDSWYNKKTGKIMRVVCPLKGGYLLEWYNSTKRRFECKDALPPFKYENDCITGEGVLFVSSEKMDGKCPRPVSPNGYKLREKYTCFANWEDDQYQYMLFNSKAQTAEEFQRFIAKPCMRIPRKHGRNFEVYFFADGVCDSSEQPTNSKDYIRMKFRQHVLMDECSDDSPVCAGSNYNTDKKCGLKISLTCRDSCGSCRDGVGYPRINFRDSFQGKWLRQVDRVTDDVIEISGSALNFPSMGKFFNMGSTQPPCMVGFTSENTIEYMLMLNVSETHGCGLHAVSISLVNRSESVLSYKISQSRLQDQGTWAQRANGRTYINKNISPMCTQVKYEIDTQPLLDIYHKNRKGWYNLVRTFPPPTAVACDMIKHRDNALELNLISGLKCSGRVIKTSSGSLDITFSKCENNKKRQNGDHVDFQYSTKKTYKANCLANFPEVGPYNYSIIQSSDLQPGILKEFACWLFSGDSKNTIYWFPVSMCDTESLDHLKGGQSFRLPLANITMSDAPHLQMTHSALLLGIILAIIRI